VSVSDLIFLKDAFIGAGPAYIGDLAMPFDGLVALMDVVAWQVHFAIQAH